MPKIKPREVVMLVKWDNKEPICACLFANPLCKKCSSCEELEMTINPYDGWNEIRQQAEQKDIYKRVRGRVRQN